MDYEKILEKAIEFCTSAGIKLVLAVIILFWSDSSLSRC